MIGLKYLRLINELSMREVGDKIGVSKQTIFKWEKCLLDIPETRIKQLTEIFNVDANMITKDVKKIC